MNCAPVPVCCKVSWTTTLMSMGPLLLGLAPVGSFWPVVCQQHRFHEESQTKLESCL